MKNYWIRIVLGALAVFALGMLVVRVVGRVREVAESAEEIEFPLAFLPFRLDGADLGELKRVRIVRATPDSVEAVHLRIELHDSVAADRLANCILVVRDVQHIDEHTTFTCAAAADTARENLVRFGTVRVGAGGEAFPFLIPRHELASAHGSEAEWERAAEFGDSIAEAAAERADSLTEVADSIAEAAEAFADSIQAVQLERADSIRREGQRLADSIRAAPMNSSAE